MEAERIVLTAENGTEHRIHVDGIITNSIYHPFPVPLTDDIDKAGTSLTGAFVYLLIKGGLYLMMIAQDKCHLERIGNKTTKFLDACFNAEESILLALTKSQYICMFRTCPSMHLRSFSFDSPAPPASFRYIELQNRVTVTLEDGREATFALPRVFDVVLDSQPIPIEPVEPIIMEPLIPHNEEPTFTHSRCHLSFPHNPEDVAAYLRTRLPLVAERQSQILARFQNVTDRIMACESRSGDIEHRSRIIRNRRRQLLARLSNLIAKQHLRDVEEIAEEWTDLRDAFQAVQFNEDYVVDAQRREMAELGLDERLHRVERALKRRTPKTVCL